MSNRTPASFSPPPAPTSPSESIAAPAEVGQVGGTTAAFQLAASQTALACIRMALLISITPEQQCACMRAFVAQANRVMDLSGWESPE